MAVLTSDPQFLNTGNLPTGFTGTYGSSLAPNNNGLSLQSNSPGINGGVAFGAPFNGSINSVVRPTSGAWDIGAYESGSSGGPVSTPTPTAIPTPAPTPTAPQAPTGLRIVQ